MPARFIGRRDPARRAHPAPGRLTLSVLLLAVASLVGCSDDDDMVTIQGVVRNVDRGAPAPGIIVSVFGTNHRSTVATGSDGRYTLRVPKGTVLELVTDDPAGSSQDVWFPLINCDVPAVVAQGNLPDWPIHCCPHSQAPDKGSVAVWDQYLQDADDQVYGDLFVPTRSVESSGVISILFAICGGPGIWGNAAGFHFETNTPAFPIGYGKAPYTDATPDPALGAEVLHRDSTVTDRNGWVLSWGDPSFTGSRVRVTCTDTVSSRGWQFATVDLPVAPGTITMAFYAAVDGQPNHTLKAAAQCLELFRGTRMADLNHMPEAGR